MNAAETALVAEFNGDRTLHGDDPRVRVLEDLERRGFGKLVYHFGWYFEVVPAPTEGGAR